jgi:hypothetical protein
LGFGLAAMALAQPALAHISLELAGTHKSRYGDGELKSGPCGRAGGTKGTNVYTYAPGQKITVALLETIVHPSYFRFAFDNDGDDAFIEPASIKPVDPNRRCPTGPGDHCGASDFYNSPAVLPNMDNLNPHITAAGNTKYTWEVTLPDVECTSCTLQVIQVMEDDLAHGPYDPTPGVGIEDIYHQCIDIVLKRSASDAGTDAPNDGGTPADGRPPPPGDGGPMDTGAGGSAGDGARGSDTGTGTGSGGSTARDGSTEIDTMTPPTSDAGGGSGGTGGTGPGGTGGGGATGSGGTGNGTGSGGTGGASSGGSGGSAGAGASGGTGPADDANGCSCTLVGARAPFGMAAGWSLLALALVSRRRRR